MERVYCHVVAPVWTTRHPDMAAGWLTRFVRHNGWDAVLLDLNIELYRRETRDDVRYCWEQLYASIRPESYRRAIMAEHEAFIRERVQQVLDGGCRVFGLLLTSGNAPMVGELSRLIKEMAPDAHVVVGGPSATSLYRYRRRYRSRPPLPHPVELEMGPHAIDSFVLGEGELTLLELLQRLEQGHDPRGIPGLVLTADGPYARFRERPLIKDLSILPSVDFEGFDLGMYDHRMLPFQLTRGCAVAQCAHCGLKGYSRGFRVRSPDHAVAEIEQNIQRYGIRELHFCDLGVNGDLEALEAFCDGVIRRSLDLRWQSFFYVRPDMTLEQLRKMVQAGCVGFNYGFESGSDTVLRVMRKLYTAADAERVLRLTREAGGRTVVNLMVGHPGEGEAEFQENLAFLERNARHIDMVASVSVTEVQIHSPLLDECDALGVELSGGSGAMWRSTDGANEWRVRNERAHRLTERLRTLDVPCHEAYWAQPEESVVRPPEVGADVRISAVYVTSPVIDPDGQSRIDQPLLAHVGYLAEPAGGWAVFDLEITDLHGQTVFRTPAATASLRAVELRREGFVRMAFGPRDLPPGELVCRVAVRSLTPDGPVFDEHVHRQSVCLLGIPERKPPMITPFTWTHHAGRLDPTTLPIEQVRVLQGDGAPAVLSEDGPPWRVEVRLRRREGDPEPLSINLRLLDPAGQPLREVAGPELTGEETAWRHELDPRGLPSGPCTLVAEIPDGGARCPCRLVVGPPRRGVARLWPRIRPAEVDGAPLLLHDGRPLPDNGVVAPGAPLTLQLPGPDAEALCRVTVHGPQGDCVACEDLPVEAPSSGGIAVDLQLNLLDGAFRLGAGLVRVGTEDPLPGSLEQTVQVRSQGCPAGGGLVFAPLRLRLADG